MLANEFGDVKTIPSSRNGGFAYANNLGIKVSCGRYVLLLNSDTIFIQDVLGNMVSYMDKNKWIGILGPKLLNKDLTHQTSIAAFPTFFREFVHIFEFKKILNFKIVKKLFIKYGNKIGSNDIAQYMKNFQGIEEPEKVQVLVGAAMLIRRSVIEDIGGLDERYFMYYEEMDFCYQAAKAGWPCVYYPKTEIIHLIGQSSKIISNFTFYQRYKSMILYFRKNYGKTVEIFVRINLVIGLIYRVIRDSIKQIFKHSKDYKNNVVIYCNTIIIGFKSF
jgi:GT2 family glycosyltransferase